MKEKSPTVRLALAGILGFTGAQRFYMGKWKTGILWLVTFGLLGIGWLADLIVALVRFAKYDKAHEKDSASFFSTLTRRFLPSISAGIGLVVSLVIVIGIWFVSVPIALRGDSAPAETEPESAEATPAEVKPADPEAPEKKAQTFQAGQVTQAAADPEAAPGEVKPAEPEENADAEQPAPEAPETDTPVVVPEPEPELEPGTEKASAEEVTPEEEVKAELEPSPAPTPEPKPESEEEKSSGGGLLSWLFGDSEKQEVSKPVEEPVSEPAPEPEPVETETSELLTEAGFIEQVYAIVPNGLGTGEIITSVTLNNRILTVGIDLSGSTTQTPVDFPIQMLADARSSSITEQILKLPWDFWDTVVIDFGDVGKSTNEKSRIVTTEYGSYFEGAALDPVTEQIILTLDAEESASGSVTRSGGIGPDDPYWLQETYEKDPVIENPVHEVYAVNTNTKKLHYLGCSSVKDIKPENYTETEDPEEYLAAGYVWCKKCHG